MNVAAGSSAEPVSFTVRQQMACVRAGTDTEGRCRDMSRKGMCLPCWTSLHFQFIINRIQHVASRFLVPKQQIRYFQLHYVIAGAAGWPSEQVGRPLPQAGQ